MSDALHIEHGEEPVESQEPARSPELDEGARRNAQRMDALKKAREARKKKDDARRARAEKRAGRSTSPESTSASGAGPAESTEDKPAAFASPAELAEFLAGLDDMANGMVPEDNPAKKVTAALMWSEGSGKPTARCLMACTMAWPQLVKSGMLENLGDGTMAVLAACVLLGPAAVATLGLLDARRKPASVATLTAVPEPQPAQGTA